MERFCSMPILQFHTLSANLVLEDLAAHSRLPLSILLHQVQLDLLFCRTLLEVKTIISIGMLMFLPILRSLSTQLYQQVEALLTSIGDMEAFHMMPATLAMTAATTIKACRHLVLLPAGF
jgi:hypothetical protein